MIPLPSDATSADVEQWCSRGVVMIDDTKRPPFPAWFSTVSSRRNVLVQAFGGESAEYPYTQVSVHWPRCGSVNLPGMHYAVHAARRTQRQYRRTWHVAGLHVITPRAWDVAKWKGTVPAASGTPPKLLAEACFHPAYFDYAEADRMLLSEEKVSVALTPRVIVAGDKSGKRMFYYNGALAATASAGTLYPSGPAVPVRKIAKLLEGRFYVAEHQ
jgi:hypothetical protein